MTQGKVMATDQLLDAAGLRRTKARALVLEMLNSVDRPLSHQEIAAAPDIGSLDRVTLYRTLTTLQRAGLLHRVQGVDGVWRFRGHRTRTGKCGGNHIHFLCLECGRMSCLPEQSLPWVKEPEGAEVFGKQLVVYGLCATCKSEKKDAAASDTPTSATDQNTPATERTPK
jgi:Fur family ferric uptake transcriptional regulator/Fur family zinc uptake transcriptional regulator